MSIRSRLARLAKAWRLKKSAQQTKACPRCGVPPLLTMHYRYTLATGEAVILPPKPESPPCTCGRKDKNSQGDAPITMIIINYPNEAAILEEAERHYAAAANHSEWRKKNEH